jgi:carbonic anhydrase/acetyltransferase-like protein (isoleucine patch superfamily)
MLREVGEMPVLAYNGKEPKIGADVFIAPGAYVIGDVEIGPGASIWFNAVVRGDLHRIVIGAGTNIQECAVLHVDPDAPIEIGANVTVGHGAVLHGCRIGEGALIGMGATVLNGAVVGAGALVAAGALVPENKQVPPGTLVAGVPARPVRELSADGQASLREHTEAYARLAASYLRQE